MLPPEQAKLEINLPNALQALTSEYLNIYQLNLSTQEISIFRFEGLALGMDAHWARTKDYESSMEVYITCNVLPEDQEMLRRMTRQKKLAKELSGTKRLNTACGSAFKTIRKKL